MRHDEDLGLATAAVVVFLLLWALVPGCGDTGPTESDVSSKAPIIDVTSANVDPGWVVKWWNTDMTEAGAAELRLMPGEITELRVQSAAFLRWYWDGNPTEVWGVYRATLPECIVYPVKRTDLGPVLPMKALFSPDAPGLVWPLARLSALSGSRWQGASVDSRGVFVRAEVYSPEGVLLDISPEAFLSFVRPGGGPDKDPDVEVQ